MLYVIKPKAWQNLLARMLIGQKYGNMAISKSKTMRDSTFAVGGQVLKQTHSFKYRSFSDCRCVAEISSLVIQATQNVIPMKASLDKKLHPSNYIEQVLRKEQAISLVDSVTNDAVLARSISSQSIATYTVDRKTTFRRVRNYDFGRIVIYQAHRHGNLLMNTLQ